MSATLAQPGKQKAELLGHQRAEGRGMVRAGFSMVEILFAILIIGILLSLLIVGVRKGIGSVRDTADRQALRTVAVAISQFKSEFGFEPPLVKEEGNADPLLGPGAMVETLFGAPNQLHIYDIGNQADLNVLMREPYTPPTLADPLRDRRFSERSLAIFLAGALESPYSTNVALPMDGVKGPGFYAPKRNGRFDVPAELLMTGPGRKSARGKVYEPMVNLGGSALKVQQDPTKPTRLKLVDRNGVGIRYYSWLHFKRPPSGPPPTSAELLSDLRVPVMVGRDPSVVTNLKTPPEKDLTQNTALRNATFALVAAGNNKFFGDEPLNDIRAGMGLSPSMSDEQVRQAAEEDNIVEVGQ